MLPDVKPLLDHADMERFLAQKDKDWRPLELLAWNLALAGALTKARRAGFQAGLAVCTFDEALAG